MRIGVPRALGLRDDLGDLVGPADVARVQPHAVRAGVDRLERQRVVEVDVGDHRDRRLARRSSSAPRRPARAGRRRGRCRRRRRRRGGSGPSSAWRLAVSVLVIVWTATGAPPPMGTPPTWIWRSEAMAHSTKAPGAGCPRCRHRVYGSRGRRARLASPLAARARRAATRRFFAPRAWGRDVASSTSAAARPVCARWSPNSTSPAWTSYPGPNYPGPFVQADAAVHLPFADGGFDLAYSNSVVEHVAPPRRRAFAAELPPGRARPGTSRPPPSRSRSSPTRCCLRRTGCRPRCAAPTGASAPRARGRTSTCCAAAS